MKEGGQRCRKCGGWWRKLDDRGKVEAIAGDSW